MSLRSVHSEHEITICHVSVKAAYVFEARIQRSCDQFGIDDGKNGPEQRAEEKWCLGGNHRENEPVNQEGHE